MELARERHRQRAKPHRSPIMVLVARDAPCQAVNGAGFVRGILKVLKSELFEFQIP